MLAKETRDFFVPQRNKLASSSKCPFLTRIAQKSGFYEFAVPLLPRNKIFVVPTVCLLSETPFFPHIGKTLPLEVSH